MGSHDDVYLDPGGGRSCVRGASVRFAGGHNRLAFAVEPLTPDLHGGFPDDYLAQQRYFDPYPEALRLRYGH